jgi:hypothetical protein
VATEFTNPVARSFVNPFLHTTQNYQQPETGSIGEGFDYGPSLEHTRLNRRFELLRTNGLDIFQGDMDAITDLVLGNDTDEEMLDTYLITVDVEAMQAAKMWFESLASVMQEQEFAKLPARAQQRLRDQGYRLPNEGGSGFAWGLGGIPYVGDGVKNMTKLAIKGLGWTAKATVVLPMAWEGLMMSNRFASRMGRTSNYAQENGTAWSLNPADFVNSWRAVEHAETSFDEASQKRFREMGFTDREMSIITMITGFGTDGLWELLAKEAAVAGHPDDPEYVREQYDKLEPFLHQDRVQDAMETLDSGRVDNFEYARKYYNANNLFLPDVRRGTKPAIVLGTLGSLISDVLYDPTTYMGGFWFNTIKASRPAALANITRPRTLTRMQDLYQAGRAAKPRDSWRIVRPSHLNGSAWVRSEAKSSWNMSEFWMDLTNVMRAQGSGRTGKTVFGAERMKGWLTGGASRLPKEVQPSTPAATARRLGNYDAQPGATAGRLTEGQGVRRDATWGRTTAGPMNAPQTNGELFFSGMQAATMWRGEQLIAFMDDIADAFVRYDDLFAKADEIYVEAVAAKKTFMTREIAMQDAVAFFKEANPLWIAPETYLLQKYPAMKAVFPRMMAWHKQQRWMTGEIVIDDFGGVLTQVDDFAHIAEQFADTWVHTKPGLSSVDGLWEYLRSEAGMEGLASGWGGRGVANAVLLPTGIVGRNMEFMRDKINRVVDFGAVRFSGSVTGAMNEVAMKWLAEQNKFIARNVAARMALPAGHKNRIFFESGTVLDAKQVSILLRNPDTATAQVLGLSLTDDVQGFLASIEDLRLEFISKAKANSQFDELFNFYADNGITMRDEDEIAAIVTGGKPKGFNGTWFRVYRNYLEEARHLPGSTNDELMRVYESGGLGATAYAKAAIVQLAYHPAKLFKKLTTYVPKSSVIDVLDEKTAMVEFDALVEMGVLADMPRDVIDHFKTVFIHGSENQRWNVQVEFLMDFVARSGALVHGGPKIEKFMRDFISKADHIYDILRSDGLSLGSGYTVNRAKIPALAHGAQLSSMNLIPNYRELAGVARYMGFMRNMGWGLHLPTIDKMFSRVWRPAVLLRIGYIPRNGGDELLQHLLQLGPKPYIRGRLARVLAGRIAMWDKYGRKIFAYKNRPIKDILVEGKVIEKGAYQDLLMAQDINEIKFAWMPGVKNVAAVHHNMMMGFLMAPLRWASELAQVGDVAVTRAAIKKIMHDPNNPELRRLFMSAQSYEEQLKIFDGVRKGLRGELNKTVRGTVLYRPYAIGQWAAARASERMYIYGRTNGLMSKAQYARKGMEKLDGAEETAAFQHSMDIFTSNATIRDSYLRDLFNTYDPWLNPQQSLDEAMRSAGYGRAVHARYKLPFNYHGSKMAWVGRGGTEGSPDWWNGVSQQLVHMNANPADVIYARALATYVSPAFERQNRMLLDSISTTPLYDAADPMGATRVIANMGSNLNPTQRELLARIYNETGVALHEADAPTLLHRMAAESAADPDAQTAANMFLGLIDDTPGSAARTQLTEFYSTDRMIDNILRPGRKGKGLSLDEVALSQSDRALDPVRYTEMPHTSIPDGQMDAFFEHWDSIGQEAPTIWVRTDLLEDYGHGFAIEEAEMAFAAFTDTATTLGRGGSSETELWRAILDPDYLLGAAATSGVGAIGDEVAEAMWSRVVTFILNEVESGSLVDDMVVAQRNGFDSVSRYFASPEGNQLLQSLQAGEMGQRRIAGQTGMGNYARGTVRVWTPTLSEPAVRVLAHYLANPTSASRQVIENALMRHLPPGLEDPGSIIREVLDLLSPTSSPYTQRTIGSFEDMIAVRVGGEGSSHIPLLTGSTDPHIANAIGKALDEALAEIAPSQAGWQKARLEVRDMNSDAFFHKPGLNANEAHASLGSLPRATKGNGVISQSGGVPDGVGYDLFYGSRTDPTTGASQIIRPEQTAGFESRHVFAVDADHLLGGARPVPVFDGEPLVVKKVTWKMKNKYGEDAWIHVDDGEEWRHADFDPDTWVKEESFYTVLNDSDMGAQRFADAAGDRVSLFGLGTGQNPSAMHEVLYEIMGDNVVVQRLQANADYRQLPRNVFAEIPVTWEELATGGKWSLGWNRVLSSWFDGVIHPAMEAMVREPMLAHYFHEAWTLFSGTEALYLSDLRTTLPGLNKVGLFDAHNIIPELEDLIVFAWPNQALDPTNAFAKLVRAIEDRDVEKVRGLMDEFIPEVYEQMPKVVDDAGNSIPAGIEAWTELIDYSHIRNNANQTRVQRAMTKAVSTTSSFIDDHRIRSQFQEWAGTLFPFWFAEDLYLRRWARGLVQNPMMIRNLQLTIRTGQDIGWVKEDDSGRRYLVIPEIPGANQLLVETISTTPLIGRYLTGIGAMAAGGQIFRLDKLMPGYDLDTVGRPQIGPFLSYPLSRMTINDPTLFHDISPFMQEKYAIVSKEVHNSFLHDLGDAFMPYPVAQVMTMLPFGTPLSWNREEQFTSAQIQAVKLRSATGRMPTQKQIANALDPELYSEEFMEQMDHEAWGIMAMRFFTWFLATGQGTLTDLKFGEVWDWNTEFHWYVKKGWTFDEALLKFYENHKYDEDFDVTSWDDQQKMNLFRVGTTQKTGLGYTQQSAAVDEWLLANEEFALTNRHITGFLVPYEQDVDYDEDMAWGWKQRQIAYGLRKLKSKEEYITDLYFNGSASEFYDRKQAADLAIARLEATGQMQTADAVRDRFGVWEEAFLNRHPVFKREMSEGGSQTRREGAISEMRRAVTAPHLVPDTPNKDAIMSIFDDIVRMDQELRMLSDTDATVADYRNFVKAFFYRRIEAKVSGHPHLQPLLTNLVIPYLDEGWVARFRAGLIHISTHQLGSRSLAGTV